MVFHESRVTKHESRPFIACFGCRVVRYAGYSGPRTSADQSSEKHPYRCKRRLIRGGVSHQRGNGRNDGFADPRGEKSLQQGRAEPVETGVRFTIRWSSPCEDVVKGCILSEFLGGIVKQVGSVRVLSFLLLSEVSEGQHCQPSCITSTGANSVGSVLKGRRDVVRIWDRQLSLDRRRPRMVR